MMRISRYDKKKLRAIFLCYTGNPDCRKSKYGKLHWVELKNDFKVWMGVFSLNERKISNTVKRKS